MWFLQFAFEVSGRWLWNDVGYPNKKNPFEGILIKEDLKAKVIGQRITRERKFSGQKIVGARVLWKIDISID